MIILFSAALHTLAGCAVALGLGESAGVGAAIGLGSFVADFTAFMAITWNDDDDSQED